MKRILMIVIRLIAAPIIVMTSLNAAELPAHPLSGTAKSIDGEIVELGSYTGRVVLVVNVASRCGFTKQYRQLQSIYETYEDRGFVILGFPCNQFGRQEPGTEEEIKSFCEQQFGVTFPLFSKIDVNGERAHPLYKYLTSDRVPIQDQGAVKWNFEKFLIDRTGRVIARYRSRVAPDAPEVISTIEAALGPVSEQRLPPRQDATKAIDGDEE